MFEIESDQITNLIMDLVAIESPYYKEDKVMQFVYEWFKQNNIHAFLHEYHESKVTNFRGKNVVVNIEGKKGGPVICLNGHLDTVKPCIGWERDQNGEVIGNRLYGVGALDMKSGCASTMIALKAFVEKHKEFNGKIIATYVSVEEGPYGMGTNALIEEGYIKDVDISIITEPSAGFSGNKFPDICLGARGGYGIEIEFFGISAHAATPEQGINAAEDASKVVYELNNVDFIEDPYLGRGSVCVVALECDGGACSVPDYAKVRLFWHIVVAESEETIIQEIKKAIDRANIRCKYKINFREAPSEGSKGFMPYTVSIDDPLTKTFVDTIKDVCTAEPSISYFKSIGDFNYLGTRLGAPAIIFGPSGSNYHARDEYVELDTVMKTTEVIYAFLEKVLCLE